MSSALSRRITALTKKTLFSNTHLSYSGSQQAQLRIRPRIAPTPTWTSPVPLAHSRENEFLATLTEPREVHVLRGFSSYRPRDRVIEAIREKVTSSSSEHQQQDSFFVIDLDRVRHKFENWRKCFPNVKPHYAVKANPNPSLLRLMSDELKLNFDCASQTEIDAVLTLGVSPNRIVYANPCKPPSHIDYARRKGVFKTTFDSESELYKIKSIGANKDWQLILRIWVDDKDAQCQLSNKYGAHSSTSDYYGAHTTECEYLLSLAKTLGLNVVGISFHVGSGAKSTAFKQAVVDSKRIFDFGKEKLRHPMSILDIGGGFPGTCASNPSDGPSLMEISNLIRPELHRDWDKVEVIAEPGRYFCSESQTLATQIIGKRVRYSKDEGMNIREYYINDGLYQSFNCMLYDHSVLLEEGDESHLGAPKFRSAIFGQTCDGLDQISKGIALPELRVGDWLTVPNMGAYTNGASSQFNGFPLNDCVILDTNNE
jgi:ornithine decarboxylase